MAMPHHPLRLAAEPLASRASAACHLGQHLVLLEESLAKHGGHALLQPLHLPPAKNLRGEHDHGHPAQPGVFAHGLEHAEAVQLGHHQVEQHQVRADVSP